MKEHIEEAIKTFRKAASRYDLTERYYRGDHNLAFATEKFKSTFGSLFREFSMNLCPAVCDAVRDKMRITGFGSHGAGTRRLEEAADRIWRRNRMTLRAAEVHKEVLKNGDAYVIVWPDADGGAAIFPHKAMNCTVVYDDENPGVIVRAAKHWRTSDRRTRLNLFYADRIERFVTERSSEGALTDAKEFVPFREGGEAHIVENAYGLVPVFHFANNADIGAFGRSELDPAIPIQDGLNKSVLDMLVAMEFSAFRQRWAAGIEIEYNLDGDPIPPFDESVDHLWIAQSENARFGDFETANLDQFLKVKDSFRVDMASVTATPLYYLLPHTRGYPSGESIRKSESRFIAKVRDRQASFGDVWADVMTFALRIEGMGEADVMPRWEDPARLSEKEMLENLLLKRRIGISAEQALSEAGYGADADELLSSESVIRSANRKY
ncbi:MAG: phage portal protein [Blastocatellia bacterium]|nr:phage portal protein [Blastocatellia bacterium]